MSSESRWKSSSKIISDHCGRPIRHIQQLNIMNVPRYISKTRNRPNIPPESILDKIWLFAIRDFEIAHSSSLVRSSLKLENLTALWLLRQFSALSFEQTAVRTFEDTLPEEHVLELKYRLAHQNNIGGVHLNCPICLRNVIARGFPIFCRFCKFTCFA